MPATLIPNSSLVAVTWLREQVPYLEGNVATELPRPADDNAWLAKGFVVVRPVGGTPGQNGLRRPVLSLSAYAKAKNSGRPPRNVANQCIEQIRAATIQYRTTPQLITAMPSAYKDAKVLDVTMRTEPTEMPGDEADYARYQADIEIWWVPV
jgi:hypothetical protein